MAYFTGGHSYKRPIIVNYSCRVVLAKKYFYHDSTFVNNIC